jgi:hypothetical protein
MRTGLGWESRPPDPPDHPLDPHRSDRFGPLVHPPWPNTSAGSLSFVVRCDSRCRLVRALKL